jgi:soluble lytic murein transglycosylase-like protein
MLWAGNSWSTPAIERDQVQDIDARLNEALNRVHNNHPVALTAVGTRDIQNRILQALEQLYWAGKDHENGLDKRTYNRLLRLPPLWQSVSTARVLHDRSLSRLGLTSRHASTPSYAEPLGYLWHRFSQLRQGWSQHILSRYISEFKFRDLGRIIKDPRVIERHVNRALLKHSVERSLDQRKPKAALSKLDGLETSPEKPCWWWYLKLRALRNLRQWKAANIHFTDAHTRCKNDSPHKPWLSLLGISVLQANKDDVGARRLAQSLMQDFPDHRLFDDALYKLVGIDLKSDAGLDGAYELTSVYAHSTQIGDRLDDAIFKVAMKLFGNNQWIKARELLTQLCHQPHWMERAGEEGRCRYWLARVRSKMGESVDADYSTLASQFPYSWYGRLSLQRLGLDDTGAVALWRRERIKTLGGFGQMKLRLKAADHRVTGERRSEFLRRSIQHIEQLTMNQEAQLTCNATDTYACLEHHLFQSPLSGSIPPSKGDHDRAAHFPMPYKASVKRASKASKVPKSLIWAIMREESHFNPKAVSFVGAKGLMQLMPGTAIDMSKRGQRISTDRLNPRVNITLGARYLSLVKGYTKTRWSLVPAGYNAGQGALRRWLKANQKMELDLFVEFIPYDEARRYTKRVNRSMLVYRSLLGRTPLSLLGAIKSSRDPR